MNVTGAEIIAVLILIGQLISIYNQSKTARKNAAEPITLLETRVKNLEDGQMKRDFQMNEMKRDIDNAHNKIRENKLDYANNSKIQNKALLAILLWIKDPNHSDVHQIDEAIKEISL